MFGNVACGGAGQRVMPLEWARGQGWVQEREFERKSSQTARGFQKVSKTEPKQGVPGQLSLSPSTIVIRGSPGNSASIGGPYKCHRLSDIRELVAQPQLWET